jgi:hypothetical protein
MFRGRSADIAPVANMADPGAQNLLLGYIELGI